jgi:NAD(P)-dependent dehydrogenase (short-subunit alcohol dehydrogenase family)
MKAARVVIITGASRGVGAGLVEAFRMSGHRVIANSRTITDSPEPEIVTIAGDIADPVTAERLVETAVRVFGRIDTLINNAGVFLPKPFTAYTREDYALITTISGLAVHHTHKCACRDIANAFATHRSKYRILSVGRRTIGCHGETDDACAGSCRDAARGEGCATCR